jgi:hypothetical protein
VGERGNDAAAFAYFPVSAGVANERDHLARLPVPPAFVARAERGGGVRGDRWSGAGRALNVPELWIAM